MVTFIHLILKNMSSLRKNFVYNSILTCSTYIFPLLVFPYVTRILGVHNLGVCNFVDSIIQYFILFSFLGMQTMATREIAKVKNTPEKLKQTFSSLLSLNMISTILAILVLFFVVLLVPKLYSYKELLFIGSAKILANTLLVEWFFVGTENFKYITIRSLIIRFLYILSVFFFVNNANDYIVYFTLTTLMFVVNAIVNTFYLRRFVSFSFKNVKIKKYLRPFLILGGYQILTSMYTSFNVAYLGFVSGETEVGYYTVATKIFTILLGIFTAFTSVMLPRMSSLFENGMKEEFKNKVSSSIDALLCLSSPIITIAIAFAPTIISIVAGDGYQGAIFPLRIIMPLMLIVGYEQILVLQILTPMNKDNAILKNSIAGALIGVILNLILVKSYGKVGSSLVWVFSELSVLIMAQYYVYKYLNLSFPYKKYFVYITCSLPVLFFILALSYYWGQTFETLIVASICVLCYYFVCYTYLIRNQHAIYIKNFFKNKVLNSKKF